MQFAGHEPTSLKGINEGVQFRFVFDNGYGASVVRHSFSYGNEQGLWELAVLNRTGKPTFTTPITNDVIGRCTEAEIESILNQIKELPCC